MEAKTRFPSYKSLPAVALAIGLMAAAVPSHAAPSNAFFAYSPFGTQTLDLVTSSGSVSLTATSAGWWTSTGNHSSSNPNYIVGVCGSSDSCGGDNLDRRDFFIFDLSTVRDTILSASLNIGNSSSGYYSTGSSVPLSFFDVFTSLTDVAASGSGRVDIYNDLGAGSSYGSFNAQASDINTQVLIALNNTAVSALNDARGSSWAVGGSIATSDIPEPGSLALAGLSLAVLRAMRRRKV